jgi:O-antigen/teichoic acid export membrane protein
MFSSANNIVMILGVLISIVLIALALKYVNELFANDTQEVLVKFILLVFTALVGVWVVDKVIAFKISLLSDNEDKELFDLIKTLILMIFSYYFGTKKHIEK